MKVEPRSPRAESLRWELGPVRHYHVIFWRQPTAPEGVSQETVAWAADEHDVLDAADIHEVIAWADGEAQKHGSVYTLYAVVTTPQGEGTIWLGGVNPTVHSRPNFERRQPANVEADAEIWEWPDSLDALVAASEFHSLLFENDDVRVLDTRIGPAETVPVHTHRWPAVLYVVSTAHLVRRDGEGRLLTDTRAADTLPEPGTAFWTAALPPHTVENVDSSEIRLLNIELKHSQVVTGRSQSA